MDGMDLIKHIRTDALRSQIPIIVLSANIDNAQRTAQQNPLFDHIQWLQKPQTPEALIAAIRNAR
jgi:CheY-like chemotaxis protein